MTFWMLVQIIFNLVVVAGVGVTWIRLNKPANEDPRMSKGLQLLQNKISVLEDLSDRTDNQVRQLTQLLEHKIKEIQSHMQNADQLISKIEHNMKKSIEIANDFQDRIPHDEIVERQNTKKYIKAAKLAHQGSSIDEISKAVNLSKGEVEFIAKINKDQLMFSEEDLPEWAKIEIPSNHPDSSPDFLNPISTQTIGATSNLDEAFELPSSGDQEALKKLGDAFKQVCQQAKNINEQISNPAVHTFESAPLSAPLKTPLIVEKGSHLSDLSNLSHLSAASQTTQEDIYKIPVKSKKPDSIIRKVEFPRIDSHKSFLN